MVLDKTRDKTARLAPNVSYTKQNKPEPGKRKTTTQAHSEKRKNTFQVLKYHTTIARESPIKEQIPQSQNVSKHRK